MSSGSCVIDCASISFLTEGKLDIFVKLDRLAAKMHGRIEIFLVTVE